MKLSLTVLAALVAHASAHTLLSKIYVDGQSQGDATCVRMPEFPGNATDPVQNLTSTDMACGFNGMSGVDRVCSVNGGSTVTFEYRAWADDASKGSIDISHKGPCAVYLKKVENPITDTAVGDGWFKIWQDGYDGSTGKWCTEKIIENNGHLSVAIPETLQGGYYLIRPELLALHDADKSPSDPQFYIGCVQAFLHSSGSSAPEETVSIPGYVEAGEPSVRFNIWNEPMALPYLMPGPSVFGISSKDVGHRAKTSLKQTEGLLPPDCVLTNANWCGVELSKYTTEDGCWNASAVCWDQCTDCYDSAPPTGSANCRIWEAKCDAIQAQCNANNFNGPPDCMKSLTPALETVSLPAAYPAQVGDGSYSPVKRSVDSTVSTDGTCGVGTNGPTTCFSSAFGDCCNQNGKCGSGISNCGYGCQTAYGICDLGLNRRHVESASVVSTNGACGSGVTCKGSAFGDCCGSNGYCGSDINACGFNCQSSWGTCSVGVNRRGVLDASASSNIKRAPAKEVTISKTGACGDGVTCKGSTFGNCCGMNGLCGSDINACGINCQPSYGSCSVGINRRDAKDTPASSNAKRNPAKEVTISKTGACGDGVTCKGSTFGNCCGMNGLCGSDINACGINCQPSYGSCSVGINRRDAKDTAASSNAKRNPAKEVTISKTGACGDGVTCKGSAFGNCCGMNGLCGSDINACGFNCQPSYGSCSLTINRREDMESGVDHETGSVSTGSGSRKGHGQQQQQQRRRVRSTVFPSA